MGLKNEEMLKVPGREAEAKYRARGVLAGNNIQSKATPTHELFTETSFHDNSSCSDGGRCSARTSIISERRYHSLSPSLA
eukprot:1718605-Heterocapsa_arctica.AAC.1